MIGIFIFIIVIIVGCAVVGWFMHNTDKITTFLDKAADKAIEAVDGGETQSGSVPNTSSTRTDPKY